MTRACPMCDQYLEDPEVFKKLNLKRSRCHCGRYSLIERLDRDDKRPNQRRPRVRTAGGQTWDDMHSRESVIERAMKAMR